MATIEPQLCIYEVRVDKKNRANIMSIAIRLLIVVAVFAAATVAAYLVDNSLGIDPGGWQHAVSIGVVAAITGIAWRNAFPKRSKSH